MLSTGRLEAYSASCEDLRICGTPSYCFIVCLRIPAGPWQERGWPKQNVAGLSDVVAVCPQDYIMLHTV